MTSNCCVIVYNLLMWPQLAGGMPAFNSKHRRSQNSHLKQESNENDIRTELVFHEENKDKLNLMCVCPCIVAYA